MVRRIVWRRDLDWDRSNPMLRLQNLGEPLRPLLEVADAIIEASKLDPMMEAVPPLRIPTQTMLNPPSLTLDGEHYAVEVDAGSRRWVYEWVGVNMHRTAAAEDDIAIARWAGELRDVLDAVIASDGIQTHPDNIP
jgi:hypothetical protein